jgi:hypothetical protein
MITKIKVQKRKLDKLLESYAGGTATTNKPSNLSREISGEVIGSSSPDSDEEALLVSFRTSAEWCLLTSKRLVWFQENRLYSLPWMAVVCAQQPPAQSAKVIKGELRGDQVTDLEIYDSAERKYVLRLEPGSSYYIVWSAILDFCNYIRQPDPIVL